jgi:quercetin dioxygenase-like cupin family protein
MKTLTLSAILLTSALPARAQTPAETEEMNVHCGKAPATKAACESAHRYYFKVMHAPKLMEIPKEPAGFDAKLLTEKENSAMDEYSSKLLVNYGADLIEERAAKTGEDPVKLAESMEKVAALDDGDDVRPAAKLAWKAGPAKGTQIAVLWGSLDQGGPYGAMIKFDAGLMHPLHSHSKDLKLVVLSGTFIHQPKGGKASKLGPGSYLLQKGGRKHVSGCAPGAPCQFFMSSDDKFDMIPAEPAK